MDNKPPNIQMEDSIEKTGTSSVTNRYSKLDLFKAPGSFAQMLRCLVDLTHRTLLSIFEERRKTLFTKIGQISELIDKVINQIKEELLLKLHVMATLFIIMLLNKQKRRVVVVLVSLSLKVIMIVLWLCGDIERNPGPPSPNKAGLKIAARRELVPVLLKLANNLPLYAKAPNNFYKDDKFKPPGFETELQDPNNGKTKVNTKKLEEMFWALVKYCNDTDMTIPADIRQEIQAIEADDIDVLVKKRMVRHFKEKLEECEQMTVRCGQEDVRSHMLEILEEKTISLKKQHSITSNKRKRQTKNSHEGNKKLCTEQSTGTSTETSTVIENRDKVQMQLPPGQPCNSTKAESLSVIEFGTSTTDTQCTTSGTGEVHSRRKSNSSDSKPEEYDTLSKILLEIGIPTQVILTNQFTSAEQSQSTSLDSQAMENQDKSTQTDTSVLPENINFSNSLTSATDPESTTSDTGEMNSIEDISNEALPHEVVLMVCSQILQEIQDERI